MSHTPPSILLSGGSGLLGSALRRAFAARRFPVLQLVRSTGPTAEATARNGQAEAVAIPSQVPWDPASRNPFADPEALEGFTAAIHLSGANVAAHRWTTAYKREIAESRIGSTHALATALTGLRHPPQVLLVASATGIYGNRGDERLDETSSPGSGFLADLCRGWEAAAQPAVHAGIRVVHLRFGVVIGPGPGALAHMMPIFRLGLGGPLGSGKQWMSWISLTDVISAILFALETPSLAGPVNLTAPNAVTNAAFTRTLAGQLHRPAFFRAPAFALRLALGAMADEALLSSARVLPARLTAAGFLFSHSTLAPAIAAALDQQR